ncbi:MAG TPA: hypothetical protein PLU33_05340 [Treponemataceae bacterium]|nr:hypothetical protein [Treponemataceae bacterium]
MTGKGFLSKKDIISASSTAVIWIILLVLSLTIQPEIETRYEVIQLVFEDESVQEAEKQVIETPVEKVIEVPRPQEIKEVSTEKKTDPAPAVKPDAAKSQELKSQEPKPAAKAEVKPAVKTAPAPAAPVEKRAEPQLVQSMEELMAQNSKPVKKEAVWDESIFESSAVEEQSQAAAVPKINSAEPVQALSGTAASAKKDTAAVSSVQTTRSASSSQAMSSTEAALQNILSAKPGVYTSQGSDQSKSFETQSSSRSEGDGVSMDLADGSSRLLLYPEKPAIVLSAESEKLINSSRTLTIVFTVLANGTVPPGNISFQPAGILPVSVQTEIRSQIARWRFEEEKSDGQARLTYSINVK